MTKLTIICGLKYDKDGQPIGLLARYRALKKSRALLLSFFGGYTETRARGAWLSMVKTIVKEPAIVWTVYTTSPCYNDTYIAGRIKDYFNQQSVLVENQEVTAEFI